MDELYFSEVFDVPEAELEKHGAFNISLVVDLPLFIDPFLLFNILWELKLDLSPDVILIHARDDNKPSASKA